MINFRCDIKLNNQIEQHVQDYFAGRSKSDLIRTAVVFYLERREQEFCRLPDEIKDNIAFLYQLILTVEDLNVEKELLKNEVTRLWQMTQKTQSYDG